MPNISSSGNISPQSMTTMSSPYSNTYMFLPISPTPPSGMMRSGVVGIRHRVWCPCGSSRGGQNRVSWEASSAAGSAATAAAGGRRVAGSASLGARVAVRDGRSSAVAAVAAGAGAPVAELAGAEQHRGTRACPRSSSARRPASGAPRRGGTSRTRARSRRRSPGSTGLRRAVGLADPGAGHERAASSSGPASRRPPGRAPRAGAAGTARRRRSRPARGSRLSGGRHFTTLVMNTSSRCQPMLAQQPDEQAAGAARRTAGPRGPR